VISYRYICKKHIARETAVFYSPHNSSDWNSSITGQLG